MLIILTISFFALTAAPVQESVKPSLRDQLRASVVSVISYDFGGTILVRGLGFFVSKRGDVLTRRSSAAMEIHSNDPRGKAHQGYWYDHAAL